MLEKAIDNHYERTAEYTPYVCQQNEKSENTRLTVQTYTTEQLNAALSFKNIDIYCELTEQNISNADTLIATAHNNGSAIYFALPIIERKNMHDFVCNSLKRLENTALDGYLVRNIASYDTHKPLIADYTLNTFNSASLALLKNTFKRVALSPELNLRELKPLCGNGTEAIVYGRLPLMTTQQCPVGVHIANKTEKPYCKLRNTHPNCVLRDRKNAEFPIITMCDSCVALIMNSTPLYMADKWQDISELKTEAVRLIFTTEDAKQAKNIIALHQALLTGDNININSENDITRGHFYRGVM
jgi:putative protease